MTISWCPYHEDLWDFSHGPTFCFLLSSLLFPIDLIFFFTFLFLLQQRAKLMEFDFIDPILKIQAAILSGTAICFAILTFLFGLFLQHSILSFFFLSIEVLLYLLIGIVIKVEAYRTIIWPHASLWIYFILAFVWNLFITTQVILLYRRSSDEEEDDDGLQQEEGVAVVLLASCRLGGSLLLLLVSLAKVFWRRDESREELYRQSWEFNSTNPVSTPPPPPILTLAWQALKLDRLFGGTTEGEGEMDGGNDDLDRVGLVDGSVSGGGSRRKVRSMKVYEDHNWWRWSRPSQFKDGHVALLTEEEEGPTSNGGGADGSSSKHESGWWSFWYRLSGRKSEDSDARPSSFEDDVSLQTYHPKESFTNSSDGGGGGLVERSSSLSSNSSTMSRALLQVMDQHRAKVNALNPMVEPKGTNASFTSKSRNGGEADAWEQRRASVWQVVVSRWGMRSSRHLSLRRESDERDGSTGTLSSLADGLGNRLVTASPTSEVSKGSGSGTSTSADNEVEFEIEVSLRGQHLPTENSMMGSNNTAGVGSNGFDQGDLTTRRGMMGSSGTSNSHRSTVWHTASELLRLHTALVSVEGDYAPRRPRLKSAQIESTHNLTNAELNMDMRSITCKLSLSSDLSSFVCLIDVIVFVS